MLGQAALRECLLDPEVERVVSVVRRATGAQHPKLREVVHADFHDFTSIAPELTGLDACLFTLGVTSAVTEVILDQRPYVKPRGAV